MYIYLLYALPTQKQNKNRCLQASRSQASFRMVCSPQLRGYASIRSQPSGPTAHQPHQHGGKRIPFEPVTRRSLATAPVRSKSHSKTPTHGNGKNKRVNLPALAWLRHPVVQNFVEQCIVWWCSNPFQAKTAGDFNFSRGYPNAFVINVDPGSMSTCMNLFGCGAPVIRNSSPSSQHVRSSRTNAFLEPRILACCTILKSIQIRLHYKYLCFISNGARKVLFHQWWTSWTRHYVSRKKNEFVKL